MTSGIKPFDAPPWIASPKLDNCGIKILKDGKEIKTITIIAKKKYVLFGRNQQMCDIKLDHPSISRRHALIGHGQSGNIYVMDLGSSHGTFVNSNRLRKKKREPLKQNDKIKFGASTREYIMKLDLDYNKTINEDEDETKDNNKRKLTDNGNNIHDDDEPPKKKLKVSNDNDYVRCYHLLVKHKDSRNPKSWKSPNITRSKEEAIKILNKFKESLLKDIELKDNELNNELFSRFKALATQQSDCSSAGNGGNLKRFGRGKMQKPFEEVSFNMKIGELSDIVETKSGVHIILRVG